MSKRIPRLEMNELAPNVQETLAARVKRLGYLGEFFKCSGHNPDVLVSFMEMTEALKEALPDRLTEVGALTVAGAMGNAYERHQHERLSEKLGFGRDWVAAVNRLEPDAAGPMSEDERAVQRLALAVVERNGHDVEAELEAVIDSHRPPASDGGDVPDRPLRHARLCRERARSRSRRCLRSSPEPPNERAALDHRAGRRRRPLAARSDRGAGEGSGARSRGLGAQHGQDASDLGRPSHAARHRRRGRRRAYRRHQDLGAYRGRRDAAGHAVEQRHRQARSDHRSLRARPDAHRRHLRRRHRAHGGGERRRARHHRHRQAGA